MNLSYLLIKISFLIAAFFVCSNLHFVQFVYTYTLILYVRTASTSKLTDKN